MSSRIETENIKRKEYTTTNQCLSEEEGRGTNKLTTKTIFIMIGYMYILKCADESYYVGSTIDLERRVLQHQNGEGANHTKNRIPVELVYFEVFTRIDYAFFREKQIQKWSRKKKEALIENQKYLLHALAICQNKSHYINK